MGQCVVERESAVPLPLRGRWLRYFKNVALWTFLSIAYCHLLWLASALPRLGSAENVRVELRPQWRFSHQFGKISSYRAPAVLDIGALRIEYVAAVRGHRKPLEGVLRSWLWLATLALPYLAGGLILRGNRRTEFMWVCTSVLLVLHLTCATACGPFGCEPVGLWTVIVELPNLAVR